METFKTSEDFFKWYLPQIRKHVPSLERYVLSGNHAGIVRRIPKLTKAQQKFMFKKIREIQKIPNNVFLVYNHSFQTWASCYNPRKKRLEIIIPVYGYYMLGYEPVIIAAVQHEMGHILNRDYLVQLDGHPNCTNVAMDCRINAQINRDALRALYHATYWFKVKEDKMIVPEEFYEDIGLPQIKTGAAYSWKTIHDYYHYNDTSKKQDKKKPKKPETYIKDPQIGDIVQIIKEGKDEGKFGKVVDIVSGKSVVEEMTLEEVQEYFDNEMDK
jgi:hypothetical protein